MATLAPGVLDLIAGEGEDPLHLLVGHPPVAAVDVQVLRAVLEEDTQRLGLIFADERGIDVAAAQAHVGADGAEDPAERVGTLPRRSEGTDGTAAGARDRAIIRV